MKAKDQFKYVDAPQAKDEGYIFLRYVVKPIATGAMFAVWLWILAVMFDI